MARTPKPWYWEARKAWYVNVKGKRIRLNSSKKEADKEFYRIMAGSGGLDGKQKAEVLVADAAEAMIEGAKFLREGTKRQYVRNLSPFADQFRNRRVESVSADEVLSFVSSYQGSTCRGSAGKFGESSKALMFRYVKSLFKWCKDTGLTTSNPLHRAACPWRVQPRRRVMTEAEYRTIMEGRATDGFKEVVEFLWRTGARSGEIFIAGARHLDRTRSIIRLQPSEHKTGTKTGHQREVYVPDDLMARLRRYAEVRPKGPLLRNEKGNPWTHAVFSVQFRRVRKRLGLPADLVPYHARHAFSTRLLDVGVSIALAAKLQGHTHTETIMQTYYHPDTDAMADAVKKVSGA